VHVSRRERLGLARNRAGGDRYLRAIDEPDRLPALERAYSNLGPLQVLQNRNWTTETGRNSAYALDHGSMLFLYSMREVKACNIHTCSHQALKLFFAIRGWTYRAYDLCTTHMIIPLNGLIQGSFPY